MIGVIMPFTSGSRADQMKSDLHYILTNLQTAQTYLNGKLAGYQTDSVMVSQAPTILAALAVIKSAVDVSVSEIQEISNTVNESGNLN